MPPAAPRRGIALLLTSGVLGVLSLLAVAFVVLVHLERRAGRRAFDASKALLLARSGLEDSLARLGTGQDPETDTSRFLGEDHDASGLLDGPEVAAETFGIGALNVADCPARGALRPSFYVKDAASPTGLPALAPVDGRMRGRTGQLVPGQGTYTLRVSDLNARIHVNGGTPAFPIATPDGPNGFLLRLLGNLAEAIDLQDGLDDGLPTDRLFGEALVAFRPAPDGWTDLAQIRQVARTAGVLPRIEPLLPYLTTRAWVDPKVARPQPMDTRPGRFLDIDDAHRLGTSSPVLAGSPANPAVAGSGTEASPWTQTLTTWNAWEGNRSYPASWEQRHVYALRQLRPGPVLMEPRAPLSLNAAAEPVLAAAFTGLKGSYLETWDGSAGWDGGFSFCVGFNGGAGYPYPSAAAEDVPLHRARLDYGSALGTGTSRPWYGPRDFDPNNLYPGKSLVVNGALGRLRETPPITSLQALALARAVRARIRQAGPFSTWAQFDAFVARLPEWEDVDDNGVLDGAPYTVTGHGGVYPRRRFQGEDWNSDGIMKREVFTVASGNWASGTLTWVDRLSGPLATGDVPGLTRFQKDVLRAMANPNTDLNDFNPDANLWKEVDKLDLAGITGDPGDFSHTTEFALDASGYAALEGVGRVLGAGGRLMAERTVRAEVVVFEIHRDTAQADFMRDFRDGAPLTAVFQGPATPYPLSGNQPLVSYPEPQTLGGSPAAHATYDGQVGLGFIGAMPGPDECLRGDLFDKTDASASGDAMQPDLKGPYKAPLIHPDPSLAGHVLPDGVYSEKDACLKYLMEGNFPLSADRAFSTVFYVGCWVKTAWRPETSTRPHALLSLSAGSTVALTPPLLFGPWNNFEIPDAWCPVTGIYTRPLGIYYVPARNNADQDIMAPYIHNASTTLGKVWPSRSLLWGTVHSLFATQNLNRRGVMGPSGNGVTPSSPLPGVQKPLGRLEGHRWEYVSVTSHTWSGGQATPMQGSRLSIGKPVPGLGPDASGGAWNFGLGGNVETLKLRHVENAGATTPNHLRFGEVASCNNMNFSADATFAGIRAGVQQVPYLGPPPSYTVSSAWMTPINTYRNFLNSTSGPATLGRYLKEPGAWFQSPRLPEVLRPMRATWTEVPVDLWFDLNNNAWMGDASEAGGPGPRNDRFGPGGAPGPDGKRDVRIALEVWDDMGTLPAYDDLRLGVFEDAGLPNRLGSPVGRLYYRAIFVNQWDLATRLNHPLDVSPFLDDVTITWMSASSPRILSWREGEDL